MIGVYLCCDVNTDQHHQRSNIQRRRLLGEHTRIDVLASDVVASDVLASDVWTSDV